jgi:hypothetical protein
MKSFVSVATNVCPICGKEFETGEILIDKRIRDSLERTTLTSVSICPEDQEFLDTGYIMLVEIDEKKSKMSSSLKPEDVSRTGVIVRLKKEVAAKIFNVEITTPFIYIDKEVTARLQAMVG